MNADDQEPGTSAWSKAELSFAPALAPRLAVGTQIAERYRIVRELAEGSLGTMYEAVDEHRDGRRVALTLLLEREPSAVERLRQQQRVLAEIEHPNIASVHGLSDHAGCCFVVSDLLASCRDFMSFVRSQDGCRCDESRLRAVLVQVVRGLAALHGRGKLHGNLTPQQLVVTGDGRVVIKAPGLAEPGASDGCADTYAAPEHLRGEPVGRKADLYAVGVILFELLTERPPFEGSASDKVWERKIREAAPEVCTLRPDAPSDLSELCSLLLQRDPALRPDAEQTLQKLGAAANAREPGSAPSLVAREAELELLNNSAQRARFGASLLVAMSGPAGVGKSALLDAFCAQLRAQPDVIVLTGSSGAHSLLPFRAFAGVVDALATYLAELTAFDAASLMPRDAGLLTRLFPALARLLAFVSARDNIGPNADEALLRVRAFIAFKQLLARIADRKLLVLCFDALQWSDDDSAELLRGPGASNCLVIGAFRAEAPRAAALAALLDSALPRVELTLQPLTRAPAEALVKCLLSRACGEVDAERLAADAQGNPRALHELALTARLHGRLRSMQEASAARFAALGDTRELLEIVALAAVPLPISAALVLVEGGARPLQRALMSSLLRICERQGRECLEIEHEQLSERLLSELSCDRRRSMHAALAHELACDPQIAPEYVALHFRAAGLASFATPFTLRAAEHASLSFAFERAIELYREARRDAAPHERAERERLLSDAYANAGRLDDAAACYERLLESSRDRSERRELSGHAMTLHLAAGQIERGTEFLLVLCRDRGVRPPPHSRFGKLMFALALLHHTLRRRFSSLPIPTSSRHDARSREQIALCFRAMRSLSPWSFEHGAYFAARAILATWRYRDPQGWPLATSWEVASDSISRGVATPEEDRAMTRAIALAEQHGDEQTLALVLVTEGGRAFYVSRLDESLHMFDRAEQVLQRRGRSYSVLFNGARSGRMAVWLVSGELQRSAVQAAVWLNEARALGDHMGVLIMHVMGSLGMLAQDDPRAARESVSMLNSALGQRSLFVADPWWFGEVALYEGDFVRARAAYLDAVRTPAFRMVRHSALHRVLCSLYLGRTYLLAASPGRAGDVRPIKQQLRRLRREQTPVARAATAQLQASLAILAGDRERAITELERAAAGYARSSMRLYAAAARHHAGVLRGGEGGRQLVEQASNEARELGALNPGRWFRSLMPSFDD